MGAKTVLSPAEYLAMWFEWEPEYVRGELRERPMPDRVHGIIESRLSHLLWPLAKQAPIQVATNLRCQLAPDVYRLPDVALLQGETFERVPTIPPIMVAEVLSRDDTYVDVIEKAAEWASGISGLWIPGHSGCGFGPATTSLQCRNSNCRSSAGVARSNS
jgi:Uma2 family endonuclease